MFATNDAIDALLVKKNEHFVQQDAGRRWKYLLMRPARVSTAPLTLRSRFFTEIMPSSESTGSESKVENGSAVFVSLDKRDRFESVEGTEIQF